MPVPDWAAAELLARETGTPVVPAVTLYHPAWGAPIRLVRDTQALSSRGFTFEPAWFETEVVNDTDAPPRATLTIPNVDQTIGEMIQQISGDPVQVAIEVIALSNPDVPIYAARRLELRGVQMNAVTVSGELASRDYSTELFGTIRVTPRRFPALFRGRG